MTEVRFYHLQGQQLEEALPKLVEKISEAGLRAVIRAADIEIRDRLDKALWEYSPGSFLPHGTDGCKKPELQPVYITTGTENPSDAAIQVSVNSLNHTDIDSYDRCLFIFDGRDEHIVSSARESWKAIKERGLEMSYWQQRETGGWEKKA